MTEQQGKKRRASPASIRFTAEERKLLEERSGGMPLSAYLKCVLFSGDAPTFRKSPQTVTVDRELAARILAALGASRIASNLSQLAKHANMGNVYFDADTKTDIREACELVREIRALLMQALGKAQAQHSKNSLSVVFGAAADPHGDRR